MTDPSDPATNGSPAVAAEPAATHGRPWGWIAVSAALLLAVVGVTIWALSLQSDLDDQRDQTAAAQQLAAQAGNQVDKLSADVDKLTQDVNNALDQAGQAGAAAKQKLQGTVADLKSRLSSLADQSRAPTTGAGSPAAVATPAAATATPVENASPDGE